MSLSNFTSAFQTNLEKLNVRKEDKILLAVSGGMDSIVMTDLFFRVNRPFSIAHCNFKLREKESDDEEMFVKQLSEKYEVKYFIKHFDTKKFSEEESVSIQMAARKLRYDWFEKLRIENDFGFIATAHHKNDNTETVLLNLVRGKGIEGLIGIPSKNNFIIRPLLFASRDAIKEYALQQNLEWRDDSSNSLDKYQRNFIRHKIVPLLSEINPSLENAISNVSAFAEETILLAKESIEKYRNEIIAKSGDEVIINTEKIFNHHAKKTLLYHLLKEFHFNSSQIELIASEKEKSGIVFYSDSHRLLINRRNLIITSCTKIINDQIFVLKADDRELHFNDESIFLKHLSTYTTSEKNNSAIILTDASKINFPLALRRWQKADYFYPLGMEHRKKLSDFFTDEKFSMIDKENAWLLVNGSDGSGEIIWIINHRLDHRYRVTDQTKKIIQFQYKKSDGQ